MGQNNSSQSDVSPSSNEPVIVVHANPHHPLFTRISTLAAQNPAKCKFIPTMHVKDIMVTRQDSEGKCIEGREAIVYIEQFVAAQMKMAKAKYQNGFLDLGSGYNFYSSAPTPVPSSSSFVQQENYFPGISSSFSHPTPQLPQQSYNHFQQQPQQQQMFNNHEAGNYYNNHNNNNNMGYSNSNDLARSQHYMSQQQVQTTQPISKPMNSGGSSFLNPQNVPQQQQQQPQPPPNSNLKNQLANLGYQTPSSAQSKSLMSELSSHMYIQPPIVRQMHQQQPTFQPQQQFALQSQFMQQPEMMYQYPQQQQQQQQQRFNSQFQQYNDNIRGGGGGIRNDDNNFHEDTNTRQELWEMNAQKESQKLKSNVLRMDSGSVPQSHDRKRASMNDSRISYHCDQIDQDKIQNAIKGKGQFLELLRHSAEDSSARKPHEGKSNFLKKRDDTSVKGDYGFLKGKRVK